MGVWGKKAFFLKKVSSPMKSKSKNKNKNKTKKTRSKK